MEKNFTGHVATIHITVNGQSLRVDLDALGGRVEGSQRTDYKSRAGQVLFPKAFGGYDSGRIHWASTRTIANHIERYIQNNYGA